MTPRAAALALLLPLSCAQKHDWRDLSSGRLMLQDGYLDQPQCVVWTPPHSFGVPGALPRWVCTIARNSAAEGHPGEHSEVLYSEDAGLSWTTGIRLEAEGSVTNSYGNIGMTDFGRLYVLYNMNLRNVTHFPDGKPFTRDDELGFMVWRYSDDGGSTWSADRYTIPLRNTAVDRNNTFAGATQVFWSVDQIKRTRTGGSIHAYTKIGTYMQAPPEESFFIVSDNVNTERNASAVAWKLFPEGDVGVRPPCPSLGCMIWEEAHVVQLATQSGLFHISRTSMGYLGAAATRDDTGAGGWGPSHFATYSARGLPAAFGKRVKNPVGPITLKRFSNGRYLLLYYCNSLPGYFNATLKRSPRNPYWLAAGWEEADGEVHMSQPEVALYYSAHAGEYGTGVGPGYPDFIEDGGIYITETNKTHARVHPVDAAFLALLFAQDTLNGTVTRDLALRFTPTSQGTTLPTPPLPRFAPADDAATGAGATIGLWLTQHARATPGSMLIDTGPLRIDLAPGSRALLLSLMDAATGSNASLLMDDECASRLVDGTAPHYAAVVIDAAAHILTWSVDGVVCDGGAGEVWGFEWVPDTMRDLNVNAHAASFRLADGYGGRVVGGGWHTAALMHSELIGTWRAGPAEGAAAAAPRTASGGGHIYALSLNGTTNVPNLLAVDLDTYIVRAGPPLVGVETIGQACVVSGNTLFAFGILRLAPSVEELALFGVDIGSGELRLTVNTSTWLPSGARVFVEALFVEASGDLLVVARELGQTAGGQFILRADATTGSATIVGAVSLTGGDVAYDSVRGLLWEITPGPDDDSSGTLATIALAPTPHAVGAPLPLTAHFSFPQFHASSGVLVGLSLTAEASGSYARNFTTLEPATGIASSVAELGAFYVVLEDGPKALDVAGNRAFFMLATSPFGAFDVVAVDVGTGAVGESVGLCGFIGYCPEAFAFGP